MKVSEEGRLSESHARCVKSWQLCVLFVAHVFWGFKINCLQQVLVTDREKYLQVYLVMSPVC